MMVCQSCGMPITEATAGTNLDGSKNLDYCQYCYIDGQFTDKMNMDEMIDFCVGPINKQHPELTKEEIKRGLQELLPTLKRWQ